MENKKNPRSLPLCKNGHKLGRRNQAEWFDHLINFMSYEPGSTDCRLLIDAKHHLEEALLTLDAMPHTDHIQRQLKAVYRQLEGMHDLKRAGGSQVSLQTADWASASVQS